MPVIPLTIFGFLLFMGICKVILEGNKEFNDQDIGKKFYVQKLDNNERIKVLSQENINTKPEWYSIPKTNNNIMVHATYTVTKTKTGKIILELA